MATVVNNPSSGDSGGSGLIVGVVVVVVVVLLLLFFGLPAIRGTQTPQTPSQGTDINIPDQVDLNVNTPKQ